MGIINPITTFDLSQSRQVYVPDKYFPCWKRDSDDGRFSRVIFFRPYFDFVENGARLIQVELFYSHTGPRAIIGQLAKNILKAAPRLSKDFGIEVRTTDTGGQMSLIITSRLFARKSRKVIDRLVNLKPHAIPPAEFPQPVTTVTLIPSETVLYCGSGVSYESGLSTMGMLHEVFGVDTLQSGTFTFGDDDPTPDELARNPGEFFARAAQFFIDCAKANPAPSHLRIAAALLDTRGYSRLITDNVDFLFEMAGVTPIRVRTIFPHKKGIRFLPHEKTLVTIGLAADRRGIVRAARATGLRIVCVNPFTQVSPRAQNLSYLREEDIWLKTTAEEFTSQFL
jgi:hypothetical protein